MKESTTNANQGAIVLIDQAADQTEINRFLNEATQTKFNWTSAEFYPVNEATYLNRRTWNKHRQSGDNTRLH